MFLIKADNYKSRLKTFIALSLLFSITERLMAQEAIEMADAMRSNGKIYVVVAVIAVIFVGLVVYLISIDKKVGKIERRIEEIEQ